MCKKKAAHDDYWKHVSGSSAYHWNLVHQIGQAERNFETKGIEKCPWIFSLKNTWVSKWQCCCLWSGNDKHKTTFSSRQIFGCLRLTSLGASMDMWKRVSGGVHFWVGSVLIEFSQPSLWKLRFEPERLISGERASIYDF